MKLIGSMVLGSSLVLVLAAVTISMASGEVEPFDAFELGSFHVEVRFFDPTPAVHEMFPRFDLSDTTITQQQLSDMWLEYLYSSAVYLFTVNDRDGRLVKHFCMRGDKRVRKSARFYKLEVISPEVGERFNPNGPEYEAAVEKEITGLKVGGTMFENMEGFGRPENRKYVGNGVEFLGKYRRVTPYVEVKNAVVTIIESELGV
jgi:hypothetical protein